MRNKIYLDACILSRLADERTQLRIRSEAEAIENVFRRIFVGEVNWIASLVLLREVNRNPDREKRNSALALLAYASNKVGVSEGVVRRADELAALGYGAFDALHLACAEAGDADALLTTDDRFLKQAARQLGSPRVRILNPIDWLKEVEHGTL